MKAFLVALSVLMFLCPRAQDISYNRKIVDTLSSPAFWGRGYTKNGMAKAAKFLAAELCRVGAVPVKGKSCLQKFEYPVNTFPDRLSLQVNGNILRPGEDFIPSPGSRAVHASGKLDKVDSATYINREHKLILKLQTKLTWSVARQQDDFASVSVRAAALDVAPENFAASIENKFVKDFEAANVCAMVKGKEQPDSFLVITAHYDHLGGLGDTTFFPGANDNASGTALLLSLAKYYALNPHRYSVVFILFAGEEAGLVGSKYFTEHPLIPLARIRFLLNTDLAGTGDDGITVVNASEFPKEFDLLKKINQESGYLKDIAARGKAANSDHYWFTEKGVPAFFFYTRGGVSAYHDVHDKAENLPLNEQADLQKLVLSFFQRLH